MKIIINHSSMIPIYEQIVEQVDVYKRQTQNGFSSTGFYVGFLLLIILVVGIYVAYTGLIKRETSKALHCLLYTSQLWEMCIIPKKK